VNQHNSAQACSKNLQIAAYTQHPMSKKRHEKVQASISASWAMTKSGMAGQQLFPMTVTCNCFKMSLGVLG